MANILVIGSSGTVGTELVRLLRAQGHTVAEATRRAWQPASMCRSA